MLFWEDIFLYDDTRNERSASQQSNTNVLNKQDKTSFNAIICIVLNVVDLDREGFSWPLCTIPRKSWIVFFTSLIYCLFKFNLLRKIHCRVKLFFAAFHSNQCEREKYLQAFRRSQTCLNILFKRTLESAFKPFTD